MATTTEGPQLGQLRLGEHARATDPPTSHAAARSLDPRRVGHQVALVVVAAAEAGQRGVTCDEVLIRNGGDRGNVARRITDARQRGLVRADGRTRRARSGRDQQVVVATNAGVRLAARQIARKAP